MQARRLIVGALVAFLVAGGLVRAVLIPSQQDLALPEALIALDSPEGQRLLDSSRSADFEPLTQHFQPQRYGSYCGVASSVVALRALGVEVSQDRFFSSEARQVRARYQVMFGGMPLDDLGGLLSAHGAVTAVHHTAESSLDAFRQAAADNLSQPGDVVIVNYHRPVLGQQGGGHISPLAAYAPDSDRFLVLDTASYKYPPTWVRAVDLWDAMDTVDADGGETRGFVLVSR
ncbi:MAG: hypothetical protein ACI8S6_001997 [Myxococcota bacterium]|jgi:hypothetical protein